MIQLGFRLPLLADTISSSWAVPAPPPSEPTLNGKAQSSIIEFFRSDLSAAEEAEDQAKLVSELLKGHRLLPLQLDKDEEKEFAIRFKRLSGNHGNGMMAIVDWKDGQWRTLGFLRGNSVRAAKERDGGFSKLITTWHLGVPDYLVISYRFEEGSYREVGERREKTTGH